ncbi:hypothetical protein [Rhizobium nepotum]|uniref:hypothetical protein n=1 Tax=Rhizobium nepotum TaxID=1035271 RepID=UPI003CF1B726
MSAADDKFDAEADEVILCCLNLQKPKSFFLYAGAGSRERRVRSSKSSALSAGIRADGYLYPVRKSGSITYTNAACDEIKQRLELRSRALKCPRSMRSPGR